MNHLRHFIYYSDSLHPGLVISAPGPGNRVYDGDITDLNVEYILDSAEIVDVFPFADMVKEVIIRRDARTRRIDDKFQVPYRTLELTTRAGTENLGIG
jgi:hypothetical protein